MPDTPRPIGGAAPFITRRSLLTFSAIATVAFFAYSGFYSASNSGGGGLGMAAAGALVLGLIAWVGGIRLGGGSGSLLWLAVVALAPPFGSLAYSIWGPAAAPPGPPATPGMRR